MGAFGVGATLWAVAADPAGFVGRLYPVTLKTRVDTTRRVHRPRVLEPDEPQTSSRWTEHVCYQWFTRYLYWKPQPSSVRGHIIHSPGLGILQFRVRDRPNAILLRPGREPPS